MQAPVAPEWASLVVSVDTAVVVGAAVLALVADPGRGLQPPRARRPRGCGRHRVPGGAIAVPAVPQPAVHLALDRAPAGPHPHLPGSLLDPRARRLAPGPARGRQGARVFRRRP